MNICNFFIEPVVSEVLCIPGNFLEKLMIGRDRLGCLIVRGIVLAERPRGLIFLKVLNDVPAHFPKFSNLGFQLFVHIDEIAINLIELSIDGDL